MYKWIKDLGAGSDPVEFESQFGMSESVRRLKGSVCDCVFLALDHQAVVGSVQESRVSLRRVIPLLANLFKPFFIGSFIERAGKVVLTGRFIMHWSVRGLMAVWSAGLICLIAFGLYAAAANPEEASALAPLAGLAVMAAGAGIVCMGRWFARNDVAWLSDVIRRALTKEKDDKVLLIHPGS